MPAGRPAATYARVLDGDHLWLALTGVDTSAALALRLADGTTLALAPEVAEPLPGGGASLRCALPEALLPHGARPGDTGRAALLVVASGDGAQPVADATAPGDADGGPTRTPPSRRGDRQHAVARDADGTLLLTTTRLAPRAEAVGFGGPVPDADALVVDVALPPDCPPVVGAALAPLPGGAPVPATWQPDASTGGRVRVGLAAAVPAPGARLLLRTAHDAGAEPRADLAVHRAHDGLRDPSTAVALPHPLVDDGGAVRWDFDTEGALVVRVVHRSEVAG